MKKIVLASLAAVVLCFVSGCYVLSVAPFYTGKDVIFEPELLGSWTPTKETNAVWTFERQGTNAYRITIKDKNEVNLTEARLFKIGGQMLFDMATTTEPLVNAKEDSKEGAPPKTLFPPAIPSHTLWRVDQFAPLRVSLMNYDWLAEYLEKHPTALRHHLIKSSKEGDKDENFAVLTAETSELQKFVLGHLKTKEAWGEYTELKKQVGKE